MRRPFLAVAVLASLAAPATANASFASHFDVLGKTVDQHRTHRGGFAFKDNLLDPANPSNSVGHDRGRCTPRVEDRVLHCRAVIVLNGELGGAGTLNVKGNLTRHDNRLEVRGGSGDFNGAAGKLEIEDQARNTDVLHFAVVS